MLLPGLALQPCVRDSVVRAPGPACRPAVRRPPGAPDRRDACAGPATCGRPKHGLVGANGLEAPLTGALQGMRRCPVCCCAPELPSDGLVTIPIFPLNMVALPAATVPLQIFEARYRVLFSTLLGPVEGVDEDLIQQDSAFLGSRRFGMCFTSQGGMAKVGTILEIQQHLPLEDGRMLVTSSGVQRFQVVNVVQERPVLVCEVQVLHDTPGEDEKTVLKLADEVVELFRSALQLHHKLKSAQSKAEVKDEQLEPEELSELTACDLSFWIASTFQDSRREQQSLLEEPSVVGRLKLEKEMLGGTVKYLSAMSALTTALTDTESSEQSPEQPGPD
ncbi:unnamed protein product [Ostreobium quekettii]|uniref:Lon N-terminal domain-containing protein n=1 Tax=Ostreobium quekettii TaxID=121088 RepID=A0A8S1IR72_9CHLO|nr:unnamed protein product [Ostreobium quekettii]|eukprot:evm.model.scf_310.2 EVM.evm.TU.scf_310.2   scf_310:4602-8719(-)